MARRDIVVRETHRGLLFRNGALVDVLVPGRYPLVPTWRVRWMRRPVEDVLLLDVRERELTIKGQEILTADKVAIRVTIITNFRVVDPKAAVIRVEAFEDRIYSDVQLAARRSLASMALEEILTNRNQLSDDILQDVAEGAAEYGVAIQRAHVKDLVFPGNLQEIMNRVLAAERLSEAERVDARTKAETSRIEAEARAEVRAREARALADANRLSAETEAEGIRIRAAAERDALRERIEMAETYEEHPSLLRLQELQTLAEVGKNANARLYLGVDRALDSSI
ncbi:MAG TPA: slipin family protein [Acidimicrobiales bacterium]|jgi:regulator of protease activity HflC (stomatin/prohibitin superfamily)